MDGTRTARIVALAAAAALAVGLAAAALLTTGPRDVVHTGRPTAVTPVVLSGLERDTAAATPRTTPPPTASEPAAGNDRPTAATTAG